MYSNYSYSQAVTGAQATTTATTTTNAVWNGQQWVVPTSPATAVANPATMIIKHGKNHTGLVSHYTTYYHYWNAQADEARLLLPRIALTSPVERDECERREKWASYYASNAAALAHYHLSLSRGGAEPYQRPVSPPAPPQVSGGVGVRSIVSTVSPGRGDVVNNSPAVAAPSGGSIASSIAQGLANSSPSKDTGKKSRWAKASHGEKNNGKFKSEDVTASAESPAFVAGPKNELYNNFVGEKKSKSAPSGTKRKMPDRKESSLSSASDSYYGPSSSGVDASSAKEEDFVPFGLDKPLGTMSKAKKAKVTKASFCGFDQSARNMEKRANRFQGKGGIEDVSNVKSTVENVEKYMGKTVIGGSTRQLGEEDFERMTVKGTCKVLEKEYLRLTAPPRPELVRPQPILEKHLANLLKSWKKGRKHDGKVRDYNWYCSQFKALRQDLTVQRIFNAFAVNVYESHAKIALEMDDINEYNQSQTQLKELYDSIQGHEDKPENKGALKNRNEFIAYRIIYYVFLSCNKKYEGGSSDIFKIMLKLTQDERHDPFIHHALLVREAVASNDYHKFFYLQDTAPNMGDFLMDKIVPSMRQFALQRICKAYRPSVGTDFVLKELGFDPNNKQNAAIGKVWMESCGCKFDGDNLLTKDTILTESNLGVKNSLI
ncbi:hypothetical protein HJC23_011598 [Cyclotella cryptica]|uniref:SAC3/GANP/THP3 conserved domain-containing protein n=1 Tax=Cyclotella cryptica TaxID=29204 RepID=A0ABD3QRF5_9STRA|eukprot:CCRYP_002722-RA/>CCRYP_002722-RA protein AED:0.01 eAED:0.01 QI:209/1/1/1/1/1/2/666/658